MREVSGVRTPAPAYKCIIPYQVSYAHGDSYEKLLYIHNKK